MNELKSPNCGPSGTRYSEMSADITRFVRLERITHRVPARKSEILRVSRTEIDAETTLNVSETRLCVASAALCLTLSDYCLRHRDCIARFLTQAKRFPEANERGLIVRMPERELTESAQKTCL